MRPGYFKVFFLFLAAIQVTGLSVRGQETVNRKEVISSVLDSLQRKGLRLSIPPASKEISFSRDQALEFLGEKYKAGNWINYTDPLRQAIGQIVYMASHDPFDSLKVYLNNYKYDSINIPWEKFYDWDTISFKVPVIREPGYISPGDSISRYDTIGLSHRDDTIAANGRLAVNDSTMAYKPKPRPQLVTMKDTIVTYIADTLYGVLPYLKSHPFRVYRYPFQGDSIAGAIKSLIRYVEDRDSVIINFTGASSTNLPVWLNSKADRMQRYWLKNEFNDSVTVWIGPLGRRTIGIFLEEGITFKRPMKQSNFSDAQLTLKQINANKLQDVNRIYVKPDYWSFRSEASFILNQASLTNWVKGGESSISTSMDITGYADYNNKKAIISSTNFARLKYGLVASGDKGIRKNLDLLETNSKLNHKAFGKFDFSATMLFKTQVDKGKNYVKVGVPPNQHDTAIVVSKFLNPATLTIGFGLDYKPNKTTSINFAPLSYKGTFVTDTIHIDKSKYGIQKGRRSLHEPGASLQFTNEFKPVKSVTITNRVQLFTNYIHNPLNIDIDWEMIATAKLNWFTDVRFNTHFIFDDDTKTAISDTNPKKTARIQFKEILGFSFAFRF